MCSVGLHTVYSIPVVYAILLETEAACYSLRCVVVHILSSCDGDDSKCNPALVVVWKL